MISAKVIGLGVAATCLLAACDTEADQSPEPSLGTVGHPETASDLQFPAAALVADEETRTRTIQAASDLLVKACVAPFGLSYQPEPAPYISTIALSERRYGQISVEDARRFGYNTPGPGDQVGDPKSNSGKQDSQDQKLDEVLNGRTSTGAPSTLTSSTGEKVPDGGCNNQTGQEVGFGFAQRTIAQDIMGQSYDRMVADSRYSAAQDDWAACMSTHSYDVSTREDAFIYSLDQPPENAIATAVRDATCAQETNFVGIANAIDAAYQQQALSARAAEIAAARESDDEVLAKAKAIIGGG